MKVANVLQELSYKNRQLITIPLRVLSSDADLLHIEMTSNVKPSIYWYWSHTSGTLEFIVLSYWSRMFTLWCINIIYKISCMFVLLHMWPWTEQNFLSSNVFYAQTILCLKHKRFTFLNKHAVNSVE